MQTLKEAIWAFEDNPKVFPASMHVQDFGKRRKNPFQSFSQDLFDARLNFVENGANAFFAKMGLPPIQPSPLGNGAESLVYDCYDGISLADGTYVLKTMIGKPQKTCPLQEVLQPAHVGYSQDINVTYKIYPKANTADVTPNDGSKMFWQCLKQGYLTDSNKSNVGYISEINALGQEIKALKIIDDGCINHIGAPINWVKNIYKKLIQENISDIANRPLYKSSEQRLKNWL